MKIPESFGFLANYHATDNLQELEHSFNQNTQSIFVQRWNRLMKKIPFLGKHLTIRHSGNPCQHKGLNTFTITVDHNHKPCLRTVGNNPEQNTDVHLLPIPHSQQTSPNGCADACLDMIGCYYDCDDLQAKVRIRSDGLRRMPKTGRPLLKGMDIDEFQTRLENAGLVSRSIENSESAIKKALEAGPIMASVKFAYGLSSHAVMIVGYHDDEVIINDPWRGGHLTKSVDWLLKNLIGMENNPLLLVTKVPQGLAQGG